MDYNKVTAAFNNAYKVLNMEGNMFASFDKMLVVGDNFIDVFDIHTWEDLGCFKYSDINGTRELMDVFSTYLNTL